MSGHTCNMSGNSGVASAKPTPVDFSTAKAKPGESVRVSTMRRQFAMLKDTFARSLVHDALMNLVLSPGPNRFRDYAFVFR
jgi:hypothetical protein